MSVHCDIGRKAFRGTYLVHFRRIWKIDAVMRIVGNLKVAETGISAQ
jgi:hypothetical protein